MAVTAAGIAAGIVIATVAGSQDELPPGDDGRVHSQPGPQTPIPPGPSLAADLAKPRYRGPLGDFMVSLMQR